MGSVTALCSLNRAPLEETQTRVMFLGVDLCTGEGETWAPILPHDVVPDASLSADRQPSPAAARPGSLLPARPERGAGPGLEPFCAGEFGL